MGSDNAPPSGPKIFISYARGDSAVADLIAQTLGEAGLTAWVDRNEVQPGDSFIDGMNQGLTKASYLVLLLSRASLASPWVSREWMAALASAETVVLPVLLEDCDIPPLLRDIVYIDLREDRAAGLARLRAFFTKERSPTLGPSDATRSSASGLDLRAVSRRTLRLLALRCVTEVNLQSFLFDAEIDAGILQGSSLHERITSLLARIDSDGVMQRFADWLALEPSCIRCVSKELRKLEQQDAWSAA